MKKVLFFTFIFGLLVVQISLYSQGQPISVTVDQIARDYENNEVAAQAKYRGKEVIVTGPIDSIKNDFMTGLHITMRSRGVYMPIVFVFPDDYSLSEFNRGDRVSIKGKVGNGIMRIYIFDCSIVK